MTTLELADALEANADIDLAEGCDPNVYLLESNAAKELRRLHEVKAELLEALKTIKDHPNTRHEVEAQLGESTWDAIAKAEGETA